MSWGICCAEVDLFPQKCLAWAGCGLVDSLLRNVGRKATRENREKRGRERENVSLILSLLSENHTLYTARESHRGEKEREQYEMEVERVRKVKRARQQRKRQVKLKKS